MKKNADRVLITGASSGIGLELARVFARNGHPLIITATVESDLAAIARDLTHNYAAEVLFVAHNLLKPQAAEQLYSAIQAKRLRIGILVNNTGIGHKGAFIHQPLHHQMEMIRLNIESLVFMTRLFLPDMIARGEGRILNVASTGGCILPPMMSLCHATKAFVLSFSEAMATEIKDTGVTMTTLCPEATDPDFFPRAEAETAGFHTGNGLSPQAVAEEGYDALMKGERVRMVGPLTKAKVFSSRFLPEFILAKFAETFYAEAREDEHQREPGDIVEPAVVAKN
jgi:short-subunit dehydrogenase